MHIPENIKRTTLSDIAKKLNLSKSTISRALRNSRDINADTQKKILEYVDEINYIPNFSARGLKTGKSNTLAIIIPFITSAFFIDFYEEICENISSTPYKLILLQTFNDEGKEKESLEFCIQNNIDGILISPVKNNSSNGILKYIMDQICPIIVFDRIYHPLETFKLGVRHEEVVYQATEELIRMGRKNIILMLCKDIGGNISRIRGYKNALRKYDISYQTKNVIEIPYSSPKDDIDNSIEDHLKTLMKYSCKPDAILSTTDTLSLKVLYILDRLQVTIPDQMHVIGFSNTPFASSLNPPLTTIVQPSAAMAEKALALFFEMVNRKNKKFDFRTYYYNCEIIHRESTLRKR